MQNRLGSIFLAKLWTVSVQIAEVSIVISQIESSNEPGLENVEE